MNVALSTIQDIEATGKLEGRHSTTIALLAEALDVDEQDLRRMEAGKPPQMETARTGEVVLSPDAAQYLTRLAVEAGMTPPEWLNRMLLRLQQTTPLFQKFVKDYVREGYEATFEIVVPPTIRHEDSTAPAEGKRAKV